MRCEGSKDLNLTGALVSIELPHTYSCSEMLLPTVLSMLPSVRSLSAIPSHQTRRLSDNGLATSNPFIINREGRVYTITGLSNRRAQKKLQTFPSPITMSHHLPYIIPF